MKYLFIALLAAFVSSSAFGAEPQGKHLFVLSGQSNMARLKPNVSFIPAVQEAFGKQNVIVVKEAWGGQPIRRWYKKWEPIEGDKPTAIGDLYDRLMVSVNKAIEDQDIATVTFVWMQGEKDAKENHGKVYAAALNGLVDQLREDLGREEMNVVIGRLSDCKNNEQWMKLREVQVEVAEAQPHGAWVDTDDLNGEKNDLHYTKEGYEELGKRFAAKAIALIGGAGGDVAK